MRKVIVWRTHESLSSVGLGWLHHATTTRIGHHAGTAHEIVPAPHASHAARRELLREIPRAARHAHHPYTATRRHLLWELLARRTCTRARPHELLPALPVPATMAVARRATAWRVEAKRVTRRRGTHAHAERVARADLLRRRGTGDRAPALAAASRRRRSRHRLLGCREARVELALLLLLLSCGGGRRRGRTVLPLGHALLFRGALPRLLHRHLHGELLLARELTSWHRIVRVVAFVGVLNVTGRERAYRAERKLDDIKQCLVRKNAYAYEPAQRE